MFNDVHLAKVSRINKAAESFLNQNFSRKAADMQINTKQNVNPTLQKSAVVKDTLLPLNEQDFATGESSAKYGLSEVETTGRTPVPHSLHFGDLVDSSQKDNNESDNNISSCSTLDIVKKVENLSFLELEKHLKEMSQRLRSVESERDELQLKLNDCIEEKEACYRQLEMISCAHESRITEMHCVIAELNKKLKARQDTTILEENELEESEISYQDESVCNSEHNLTNPDVELRTGPFERNYAICEFNQDGRLSLACRKDMQNYTDTVVKSRAEVLQEEVLYLKAQIALLQSQIAEGATYLGQERPGKTAAFVEDSQISEGEVEENAQTRVQNNTRCNTILGNQVLYSVTPQNIIMNASQVDVHTASMAQTESLIPKMAEKVKIRHLKESRHGRVIAPTNWVASSEVMDNLRSNILQIDDSREDFVDTSDFEKELHALHREIEQHKMQNVMLSLTLDECKEHCEELYLLCGKYESNAIALQSAVNCTDRAIEGYDVMLALLESKMALMKENSAAAEESRKSVESVARNLLVRLENEKSLSENSLGPWKNTFSFTDKSCAPWTSEDDNRLRYHVSKLKGRRSMVQNTIVNLESPFRVCYEKTHLALEGCSEALSNLQLSIKHRDCFTGSDPAKPAGHPAISRSSHNSSSENHESAKTKYKFAQNFKQKS